MTRVAISRSQWLALTLIPVLSIALLSSPVVEWFEGPQLLSALLVMAGLVLFATGALPEFVTALLVLTLRSEEHTSELQSRPHLVCRLLLEKKNYVC